MRWEDERVYFLLKQFYEAGQSPREILLRFYNCAESFGEGVVRHHSRNSIVLSDSSIIDGYCIRIFRNGTPGTFVEAHLTL